MAVPFFSVEGSYQRQSDRLTHYIARLFDDCDFVNGGLVRELEEAIKQYTGARHAIAVGNASDGLTIAMSACEIERGSDVICPAMTFVSSASSVIHAGARPVFADIDRETYSLDLESVRKSITPNTRALMVVHLFHQPARMPELLEIAQAHGLTVIEDSAESAGMWCSDRHTGLAGRAGVISFFPTKTLGCFGDGGIVITNDDEVAAACMELRDHGRRPDESQLVLRPGHSSRLDSVQAAILLSRIEALDHEIERRAGLADLYSRRLAELPNFVVIPKVAPRSYPFKSVWYVYTIQCVRRDQLAEFLAKRGILTETYYPLPLHLQPAFAAWGHRRGDFPVAEEVCSRILALPFYPDLEDEQVNVVCDAICEFYGAQ